MPGAPPPHALHAIPMHGQLTGPYSPMQIYSMRWIVFPPRTSTPIKSHAMDLRFHFSPPTLAVAGDGGLHWSMGPKEGLATGGCSGPRHRGAQAWAAWLHGEVQRAGSWHDDQVQGMGARGEGVPVRR